MNIYLFPGLKKGVDDLSITNTLIEKCRHYKFHMYAAHISEYVLKNTEIVEVNTIPPVNSKAKREFEALIENMPISSKDDFLMKVLRELFIRYAKILKCSYVFTAETSDTLAMNLLLNISNGRGSQVQHDIVSKKHVYCYYNFTFLKLSMVAKDHRT